MRGADQPAQVLVPARVAREQRDDEPLAARFDRRRQANAVDRPDPVRVARLREPHRAGGRAPGGPGTASRATKRPRPTRRSLRRRWAPRIAWTSMWPWRSLAGPSPSLFRPRSGPSWTRTYVRESRTYARAEDPVKGSL